MSLKIAVCIKQVPDITEIRINPDDNTLMRSGIDSVTNPFDIFAIEESVKLKEKHSDVSSVAISMGPKQAKDTLNEALALGIDEAILLSDIKFAGSDTWATSLVLAEAIKKSDAKLVICGKQATDGDTAQVGPEIATHLNWPQACYVCEIIELSADYIIVKRHLDYGTETLKIALPAVITVGKDINNPRLTELEGLIESWEKPLHLWTASDLNIKEEVCGLAGSPTQVSEIFAPEKRAQAMTINGCTPKEKATKIADIIKPLIYIET